LQPEHYLKVTQAVCLRPGLSGRQVEMHVHRSRVSQALLEPNYRRVDEKDRFDFVKQAAWGLAERRKLPPGDARSGTPRQLVWPRRELRVLSICELLDELFCAPIWHLDVTSCPIDHRQDAR